MYSRLGGENWNTSDTPVTGYPVQYLICVQITAGPSVYDSLRLAFDDMETADVRYSKSKKSWPILYSNLLYEMVLDFYDTVYKTGQDFFDIQYTYFLYENGQAFWDIYFVCAVCLRSLGPFNIVT